MINDQETQRAAEARVWELAEKVAGLLTEIEQTGGGLVAGRLQVPGARIVRRADGWEVTR